MGLDRSLLCPLLAHGRLPSRGLFAFPRRPGYALGILSPWTVVPPMMASYRVAILACAAWGAIACSAVRADFLQATANATSVSVSLTVGSGAFPQINSLSFQAGAQVAIGPQSLGPFTSTTSVGPLQLSDTLTESTAQSYGAVTTAVINGNKTFNISTSSYGSASSAFSAFANGFGGTGNLSHAMNIGPFANLPRRCSTST